MPEKTESLRIVSLQASNIKKLKAITIAPTGNVVTLTGPNGSGKSSVLDSIWYALGGKENICDQPVRRGASSASTVVKIGTPAGEVQLVCTRKISSAGTSIQVTDAEGRPQSSPQTLLDRLIGNLSFDPLEFARMGDKPRVETLRKLVGLDFQKEDQERQKLYDDRTLINREKDRLQATLNSNPIPKDAPSARVSVQDLMAKLSEALTGNQANDKARDAVKSAQLALDAFERQRKTAEEVLRKALAAEQAATEQLKTATAAASNLTDTDLAPIRQAIGNAEAQNALFEQSERAKNAEAQWADKDKESRRLTDKIEAIDRGKQEALAAAKFPLPGLSFDENGVVYGGLPFAQASTGEQLRVSVAVGMALNPRLRVIFIRDGSLIDEAGLALIAELAKENEYQVWIETVRSADPTAVVIEDGEVKEATV